MTDVVTNNHGGALSSHSGKQTTKNPVLGATNGTDIATANHNNKNMSLMAFQFNDDNDSNGQLQLLTAAVNYTSYGTGEFASSSAHAPSFVNPNLTATKPPKANTADATILVTSSSFSEFNGSEQRIEFKLVRVDSHPIGTPLGCADRDTRDNTILHIPPDVSLKFGLKMAAPADVELLKQVEYVLALLDHQRRDAEINTRDSFTTSRKNKKGVGSDSASTETVSLLKAANVSDKFKPLLSICTLDRIPKYQPNYVGPPGGAKTTARDDSRGSFNTYSEKQERSDLSVNVPVYLQNSIVADTVVMYIAACWTAMHEVATMKCGSAIPSKVKVHEKSPKFGKQAILKLVGLRYTIMLSVDQLARTGVTPRRMTFLCYERHDVLKQISDVWMQTYNMRQFQAPLRQYHEYPPKNARGFTSPTEHTVQFPIVPVCGIQRVAECRRGVIVYFNLAPGVPGNTDTLLTKEREIRCRNVAMGMQWSHPLITKTGNQVQFQTGAQAMYVHLTSYDIHKPFGLSKKDDGADWLQFGTILLRSLTAHVTGTIDPEESKTVERSKADLPYFVKPERARDLLNQYSIGTVEVPMDDGSNRTGISNVHLLMASDKKTKDELSRLIISGYPNPPLYLKVFVNTLLVNTADTLSGCAFPVTKALALQLLRMNRTTPTGKSDCLNVGMPSGACSDSNVVLLSVNRDPTSDQDKLDTVDETKFAIYAVSSATSASDMGTFGKVTTAMTTTAFVEEYLETPSERPEYLKSHGAGELIRLHCFSVDAISKATYLLFGIRKDRAQRADEERKEIEAMLLQNNTTAPPKQSLPSLPPPPSKTESSACVEELDDDINGVPKPLTQPRDGKRKREDESHVTATTKRTKSPPVVDDDLIIVDENDGAEEAAEADGEAEAEAEEGEATSGGDEADNEMDDDAE